MKQNTQWPIHLGNNTHKHTNFKHIDFHVNTLYPHITHSHSIPPNSPAAVKVPPTHPALQTGRENRRFGGIGTKIGFTGGQRETI